ncbi:MAG: pseudouridine synthase [Myxococcota bacterium]
MLRLHKFLAQAGLASRRHAEGLIKDGRVRVNGQLVTELGAKIDPETDEVSVDGRAVRAAEAKTTIVLEKPAGVVTTMSDPEGRRTVAALVAAEPYRLVPVGRLDFPTEGVLLLTTDGELAHRLLHPSHKVPKIYVVKVGGHPTEARLATLRSGVQLEDGMTQPALVEVLESGDRWTWLEMIITEGRQRQVRRMCEAVEHRPLRVVRTSFATITNQGLKPGQYRYLTKAELAGLYRLVGLEAPPLSERARETEGQALGEFERGKGALPDEAAMAMPEETGAWRGRSAAPARRTEARPRRTEGEASERRGRPEREASERRGRPEREEREASGRRGRPVREEREASERRGRPEREERPSPRRFERSAEMRAPRGDEAPRRSERPSGAPKGRPSRSSREALRGPRPRPDEDRPSHREDRPLRADRPARREDRSAREERPTRDRREERPTRREDRPRRFERPAEARSDAPSERRRFQRPSEDRPRREEGEGDRRSRPRARPDARPGDRGAPTGPGRPSGRGRPSRPGPRR